jgi:hypothetical protein
MLSTFPHSTGGFVMRYRRSTIISTALVAAVALPALATATTPTRVGMPAAHLISHSKEAVPFLADDYAGALAAARARHVPIFVEAWAPW